MPDDETLNYIPTQVIAAYLASLQKPQVDVKMCPSVQVGDDTRNVVLFNKAAVVVKVERPTDVTFEVRDYANYEGGPETEYSVKEEFDSEYVALEPKEPTPEQILAEMNAEVQDRDLRCNCPRKTYGYITSRRFRLRVPITRFRGTGGTSFWRCTRLLIRF